jgi:hypothetical protein
MYLKLKLGIIKVGGYDFSDPSEGPWTSHLFFMLSLVDIDFDMPVLVYRL